MQIRCPHCRHPFASEGGGSFASLACPACGSTFSLALDDTLEYDSSAGSGSQPGARAQAVGQFQLVEKLGAGSFGTVWRARDTKLDRMVAVKLSRTQQLDDSDIEWFLREAQAAAQLMHPNIVAVHEIG